MMGAIILVVEDEAIVAMDLQSRLRHLGFHVPVTVMTGEEAIQRTEEIRPDLIFMDIGLQGVMDGIQAAEQIISRFATPIVFLTAYGDAKTRQRAEATAPIAFLSKPFEDEDLLSAVKAALSVQP